MCDINIDTILDKVESFKLYRQSRVVRWQLRDFMFSENDSEHQLYVSQLIVYLSRIFNISQEDELLALRYGCIHDYVESCSGVGDINYKVKQDNPKLKEIVEDLEDRAMLVVPEFYNSKKECESNIISKTLVNLADTLDAVLYVRREMRYNKNDFEWAETYTETYSRAKELFKELFELVNK